MMKRVRLFSLVSWLVFLVAICIFSPLNLKAVLPSGTIIAPITALLAVSALPVLGMLNSVLLVIVGQLILLWFNQSDWLTVVVTALTVLLSGWVVNWQQSTSRELQHQQMITVGIASGLIILILLEVAYCIVGWQLTGSSAGMGEIMRLALPTSLLTALCYALLIPPFGILFEHISKKFLPPVEKDNDDDHDNTNDSVIIDLSYHKEDQDNKK